MKLINLHLAEGLVKVPEVMLSYAIKQFCDTALSQAISDIENEFGKGREVGVFRLWARKAYPGTRFRFVDVREDPVLIHIPHVKRTDFDARYQKWVPSDLAQSPTILVSNQQATDGNYSTDNNQIEVSITRLTNWDWDIFGRAVNAPPEMAQKGQKAVDEILARVKNLIDSMLGTVRHELMHYVQFLVLDKAHTEQTDGDRAEADGDGDDYYMSNTEFDPQIESAISNTLAWFSKLQRNLKLTNAQIKTFAAFLTGSIPHQDMVKAFGTDKLLPSAPIAFFETLKRRSPAKWKKAVRKYFQTLISRLQ